MLLPLYQQITNVDQSFSFLMVMVGVELILKIYSGCALVAAIKVQMPG